MSQNHWKYDGVSSIFEPAKSQIISYDPYNIISNSQYYPQNNLTSTIRRMVIPVGLQDESGLGVNTPSIMEIDGHRKISERVNVTHTARKLSGFKFSRYSTLSTIDHEVLMSMESYKEILYHVLNQKSEKDFDVEEVFKKCTDYEK